MWRQPGDKALQLRSRRQSARRIIGVRHKHHARIGPCSTNGTRHRIEIVAEIFRRHGYALAAHGLHHQRIHRERVLRIHR